MVLASVTDCVRLQRLVRLSMFEAHIPFHDFCDCRAAGGLLANLKTRAFSVLVRDLSRHSRQSWVDIYVGVDTIQATIGCASLGNFLGIRQPA